MTTFYRPLLTRDIEVWRAKNGLSQEMAQSALGIADWKKTMSKEDVLPLEIELLVRLYDEIPGPAPWPSSAQSLTDVFWEMHGERIALFKGEACEANAKVDCMVHFGRLLGRSKTAVYRWTTGMDGYCLPLELIAAKLSQFKSPGKALLEIGSAILLARGEVLRQSCPLPTLKNPPERMRRGRKPGQLNKHKQSFQVARAASIPRNSISA